MHYSKKRKSQTSKLKPSVVKNGVLLSNNRIAISDSISKSTSRIPKPQEYIRHEPVNYLELRRLPDHPKKHTDAKPLPTHTSEAAQYAVQRERRLRAIDALIAEPVFTTIRPVQYLPAPISPLVDARVERQQTKKMSREIQKARQDEKKETTKLEKMIDGIRNNLSEMYVFTPTFKIWSRHKSISAIDRWKNYVLWHRSEERSLYLLVDYASKIQKAYRMKKAREMGKVMRNLQRNMEVRAVTFLQAWIRGHLDRFLVQNIREEKVAIQLQAGWRGKCDRARVKQMLRERVRSLLRYVSPTGSLARLKEVVTFSPKLQGLVAHAMTMIEETSIALQRYNQIDAAADTFIESETLRIHVSRRELFDVMHRLTKTIVQREAEIQQLKNNYENKRQKRINFKLNKETKRKQHALDVVRDRIECKRETEGMEAEERYARELVRTRAVQALDKAYRVLKAEREREVEECQQLAVEDMEMRYLMMTEERMRKEHIRLMAELLHRNVLIDAEKAARRAELVRLEELAQVKHQEVVEIQILRRNKEAEKLRIKSLREQKQMKVRLVEKEQSRLEMLHKEEQAEKVRAIKAKKKLIGLERKRKVHWTELEREHSERLLMDFQDILSRKMIFEALKDPSVEHWKNVHEDFHREKPVDPLNYLPQEEDKKVLEKSRREQLFMKLEDEAMLKIRFEENKRIRLAAAKAFKIFTDREMIFEASQRKAMQVEEEFEQNRLSEIRKNLEYEALLERMKIIAEEQRLREELRIKEAKSRKMMYDEEMRQRRYLMEVKRIEMRREERARRYMTVVERKQHEVETELELIRMRKLERARRNEMAKEDYICTRWNQVERDGYRLESIFWQPIEAVLLRELVADHAQFLRHNVWTLCEFADELSPEDSPGERLSVAYPSLRDEKSASLDKETEDMLAAPMDRTLPPRERWKWAFFRVYNPTLAREIALLGYSLLESGYLVKGCATLKRAFTLGDKSSRLLRILSKASFTSWTRSINLYTLIDSYYFFTLASKRLELLCSPAFLFDLALVLEANCKFKHAAELLGRIITTFPSYDNMTMVIFHAGVMMVNIGMFDQGRTYILHTLEDPPKPWKSHDVLFMVARIYEMNGEKKLGAAAFEEAFKSNSTQRYYELFKNCKEWLADTDIWRNMANRCYDARLYILAKDFYQQTLKRRDKGSDDDDEDEKLERLLYMERIWFRLATCQYYLGDRKASQFALKNWFVSKSYPQRVKEILTGWDADTWNELGLGVPDALCAPSEHEESEPEEVHEVYEENQYGMEEAHSEPYTQEYTAEETYVEPAYDATYYAVPYPWQELADEGSGEVYYWNEETNETRWDRPVE